MKEEKMSASIRFIIRRFPFQVMVPALMSAALALSPVLISAAEDPCREAGVNIGNQTMLDVWYVRNGGPCTIWIHGHLLTTKPDDTLIIYSDMTCKTEYCPRNPGYDIYKSVDANQNCRVRILPDCTLSDM
jgi:hypothetical protein